MGRTFKKRFRAPYAVPNGLQVVERPQEAGAPEGRAVLIADQITDRVALVALEEADGEYGVPRLIHEIATESSNTSGLTYGAGSLWLAANGPAGRWRAPRPADAKEGRGEILQIDPATGRTLNRFPVPGGGGVHGIEYDPYDAGTLWVTTLKSQTVTQMSIAGWAVRHVVPLPYGRAHGVVRVEDGLWVVHTSDRVIVKLDLKDGSERDRIEVPRDQPEPHCLSAYGSDFLYCDATSGWVVQIS